MEKASARGKFIVFEGTDGSGKSTQMKLLGKYLKERGVFSYLTCEPTQSPIGALLRSCLTGRIQADEHTVAALFAADRLDHINNPVDGIKAKIERGETVLCDRYYYSSLAYNGQFVSREWVAELNRPAMELLRPDLVIFIDITPEKSMERVLRRGGAERYESLEKQRAIRENFFEVFKNLNEGNLAVVESEEDKTATQINIRRNADKLFGW